MNRFKWIGPTVECYNPALAKGFFEFYRSFSYNNETYNIGDFVIVKKAGSQGSSRIGKLLCVYHSKEAWHKNAPYRGTVRWYAWARDLRQNYLSLYKDFDVNNELVEDRRSVDVFISLEHIQKKCFLVLATEDDPVCLIKEQKLNPEQFFSVRYKIENVELLPLSLEDDFNDIYLKNKRAITEIKTLIPLLKMTPRKRSATESKSRTVSKDIPTLCVDSETSDGEEKLIVKSISNSLKNIKLTPVGKSRTSTPIAESQMSSVKRVLNNSFEKDDSPLFLCSLVSPKQEDPERVKIKLKLIDKNAEASLKVFPTKLDDTVVALKSPVKMKHLQEVDNCISLSPKSIKNYYISSEETDPNSKMDEKGANNKMPVKCLFRKLSNDDIETSAERRRKCKRRITDEIGTFDNDKEIQLNTPKRINNSRRCSSRNIQKRSYIEINSEDSSEKKSETRSIRRPKRNVVPPKRYDDENFQNELQNKALKRTNTSISKQSNNQFASSKHNHLDKLKDKIETESSDSEASDSDFVEETKKAEKGNNKRKSTSTPKTPKRQSLHTSVIRGGASNKKLTEGKPQTPKTPRRPIKDTPTARARMVRDGIITPSVPIREKAITKDNTPLGKARVQLHVSYVPKALPCRQKEFSDVFNFLEVKLLDGCGGCMYISGVPGTGKTATVTEVIRSLQQAADIGEVPTFKFVGINGMKLSEPKQAYVEIVKQLTGKTVAWEEAQTMLENKFVKSKKKTAPTILLVDELDILCTKRQDVIYNLLDWPTKQNAQLIVITIANTMDLPEKLLMGRVTSRLGLTRLTFQAYTHRQLQEIVMKRLSDTNTFNADAIQLVARKVASISGDARRALDICRRATEVAELEGPHTQVSMIHVSQVINAMITQPKVQAIKHCCRLEKLILQAVVAEVERTGVEETNFVSVMRVFATLAALDGFRMVSTTVALAAVNRLGSCRLLLVDQKNNNVYQKIILNVSGDDVYYAITKTDV